MIDLKLGRNWLLDSNGYILNDASVERIDSVYGALLEQIDDECRAYLGSRLRSLFVRGSVPRGVAVPPVADIDLIAVTTSHRSVDEYDWGKSLSRRYGSTSHPISGVDVEWCVDSSLLDADEYAEVVLQLATQSVCLSGADCSSAFPRFRPDERVANFDLVQIGNDLQEAKEELESSKRPEEMKYWCQRISKNILRTGFSLVMVNEGQFTRDLAPCYLRFKERYPQQASEMFQALQYAVNPSTERCEVLGYLDRFGAWMTQEAEKWLERHNPARKFRL